MPMILDYSTLSQPVTQADIDIFKSQQSTKNNFLLFYLIAGFVTACFLGAIVINALFFRTIDISPLIVLPFTAGCIYLLHLSARKQLERRAKLHRFAAANNIRLICDSANPAYAGMIFDEGDSRQIDDALIFRDGTEIGNYQYSTGSGKNRQTHTWGYARIKLTRHLPNMVLDARKNNLFGSMTNLPDSFDRNQTLSLEGDFNNHFTLYAPKEYERDALYIFTPDVMAAVIDSGRAYDMEVIDDSLMLYSTTPFILDSKGQLNTLLGVIEKIGNELRDQSDYYADERVGNRTANIIAEPGRRLKSGVNAGAIVAFVLVILYFIFMSSR